jgi:chemotaxis protein histidine kinase CheA
MADTRASMESLHLSIGPITPIPTALDSVLPEDEIIDNGGNGDAQHHDQEDEPSDEDEEDDEEPAHPEPETHTDDVISMITDDDNKEMIAQNRMLLKLLFEQQAEWKEERTQMLAEFDRSRPTERNETSEPTKSKIFKMVDPVRYCCGAKELDKFLESLRSNFDSHKHLFPKGGPNRIKYAISFLETWNNHTDASQRQMKNTDPSERASDVRDEAHPCLQDFELFAQELMKMYGDKDQRLNSAMKAMQEYQQLPNESVRVYANRMKANWRRAGCNLITHDVVVYDMAWSGLRHALKTKVRQWIPKDKDRFERLDELFDSAAASESKPEGKKPGGQQQQQQRHPNE